MRGETWVSLVASLIGIAVPMVWMAPHLAEHLNLLPAAGMVVFPFILAAGTGWVARADRWGARVNATASVLVLVVGLGGWLYAAQDEEGGAVILTGLLFIPASQFMIWFGGAIIAARRGRNAETAAAPEPPT